MRNTRTKGKTRPSSWVGHLKQRLARPQQQGQAIVLIALLILVLFAMLGLAIDSGRGYVDRRDQQTAVDAAALAAGDFYDNYPNYPDVSAKTLPAARQVYESNLHLYGGPTSHVPSTQMVGVGNKLVQDTWVDTFNGGYTLTIVATDTQFNGYQFQVSSTHQLPLAFMQIFGGSPNVTINATASAIVGNQRQTPALLTLSPNSCATSLSGNGSLTVLGDIYTNGTTCINNSLHLAGNCYGAAGSNCSAASYYCYNSSPGFIPYPPPCVGNDILGGPNVPAPSLPDPGYLATSVPSYQSAGLLFGRGTYTEMTPGLYSSFALTGGAGCYFLDAGVYSWNGGYSSHGGMVSNELKAPDEEQVLQNFSGPGTTTVANPQFWSGCPGHFTLAVNIVSGHGVKHGGLTASGNWGVVLTSVRYDRFLDGSISSTCLGAPGCRRESAPSACQVVSTADVKDQVIDVSISTNAPGAQYYNVYIDPNGCDGITDNFSFVNTFNAPGFVNGIGGGPYPNGGAGTVLSVGLNAAGRPCSAPGHTICDSTITPTNLLPNFVCFAQVRVSNCRPPDDEYPPACFQNCPPSSSTPQENAPMDLQYPPNTGGDVANENYCVISPNPGDKNAPCTSAKVTPGAVQFYLPNPQCMDQNGGGYTHVFSGEQYNWIIIYSPPGVGCGSQKLNGNAFTQYIGTIYTPGASWDILGTDKAPLAGQVICYTASVTGNGAAGIDFNPNYSPAPPAARLIN
ncbi:MAG: pilus assembly protein TadG-related protein [Candidatus Dormiibacterota bacterium]